MKKVLSAFSLVRNIKYLLFRSATNVNFLDGLRAMSMLLVLAFHSYAIYVHFAPTITLPEMIEQSGWLWSWVLNSDKGVDIFFVISGYLITGILLRQIDSLGHVRLGNFYMRRFMRLTPVYFIGIGIYILIGGPHQENIWANFVYLQNFIPYDEQAMNWTWSLAIEEQFYLLYPLLLVFLVNKTRNPIRWFVFLMVLACLIRLGIILSDDWIRTAPQSLLAADPKFHAHHFSVLYDNLYTRYGALLAGCFVAYLNHYHTEQTGRFLASAQGQALGWLSFVVVAIFMIVPMVSTQFDAYQWLNIGYQTVSRVLFGLAIGVWILLALHDNPLGRFLNWIFAGRFWHPLAQLSYSMYLMHVLAVSVVVSLLVSAMKKQPEIYNYSHIEAVWIVFGVSTLITVIIATLLYLIVERPLMNLRK